MMTAVDYIVSARNCVEDGDRNIGHCRPDLQGQLITMHAVAGYLAETIVRRDRLAADLLCEGERLREEIADLRRQLCELGAV